MHQGKFVFSQIVSIISKYEFSKSVNKYQGDYRIKEFKCWPQFLCMMFGQLTYREGIRDVINCLGAHRSKLYHLGIKKLVAYSSVAHLGFVMLGVFALNLQGMAGGLIQMVNHGISTGALFLIVGFIYERRHTRLISEFGGLAHKMPILATIFLIITFSSIGLPGTNGFVGEFLALVGAFESGLRWYAVVATTGVIFAAVYMLWMFQRVMFGKITNPENEKLKDLSVREIVIMIPLLIFVFWIGIYPNTFLSKMNPAIEQLLIQVKSKQVAVVVPVQPVIAHSLELK